MFTCSCEATHRTNPKRGKKCWFLISKKGKSFLAIKFTLKWFGRNVLVQFMANEHTHTSIDRPKSISKLVQFQAFLILDESFPRQDHLDWFIWSTFPFVLQPIPWSRLEVVYTFQTRHTHTHAHRNERMIWQCSQMLFSPSFFRKRCRAACLRGGELSVWIIYMFATHHSKLARAERKAFLFGWSFSGRLTPFQQFRLTHTHTQEKWRRAGQEKSRSANERKTKEEQMSQECRKHIFVRANKTLKHSSLTRFSGVHVFWKFDQKHVQGHPSGLDLTDLTDKAAGAWSMCFSKRRTLSRFRPTTLLDSVSGTITGLTQRKTSALLF